MGDTFGHAGDWPLRPLMSQVAVPGTDQRCGYVKGLMTRKRLVHETAPGGRRRRIGPRLVLLVTAGLAAVTAACSDGAEYACSDAAVDFSLPTESLTDWVSYADQLSVVEVLAEERLWPPPPTSGAPPAEYVGRRVDVRVGETAWRRPDAPTAPDRLSFVTDGWSIRRGHKPVTIGEGPRLQVGRRYLMGLVRFDEGDWGPFPRATLPLDPDGRLARVCSKRPTLTALVGLTVAEAGRLLRDTAPDPRTVAHVHQPPVQRYQTVAATR
jgi:hypothetical protein